VNNIGIFVTRLALIVATGLAMVSLPSAPSHAAAKIQHLISPGGIEAWFVQDSTVPLIAMEYAFRGGAAQDPAGKSGVGNIVADTLDEGSGDLDSSTFHERLDRRAIELSFSSTRDAFRGSLRMLKDNKDEAFDLLRMSLTSPHFDSADVERIRSQVISNLKRDTTNPSALAGRKFLEMAYGDHPYGRQANGTLESVPKIQIADLKDYVRRVLAKDSPRVTRSYNQDLVGQFAVQCPGEALADRIRPRCAWWRVISLVSASNTASNIVVYFVSRPLIRNRSSSSRSPRSIARFRGLLGDPAAGRVGRHAGDMQLPGRMPAKISTYKRLSSTCRCAGSHSGRYAAARGRSLPPSRFPPGRVRDRVTEPGKLALDPAVTSARVCPGHRNDELLIAALVGGRPRPALGIGPFAGYQPTVPREHRRRSHREHLRPVVPGDQPR